MDHADSEDVRGRVTARRRRRLRLDAHDRLAEHPAVHEAAAIPVDAEVGEDDILVAVVKRPGYDVTAEEIATWCRERLAPMKVPRFVAFVDELPHTPTHKVAKMILRADKTLRERATDLA